ncbi:MAG: hypothetical protein VX223_06220 [Myxococcota bacterium]|nr:hypothetical protein [Myxococcota bacterium]
MRLLFVLYIALFITTGISTLAGCTAHSHPVQAANAGAPSSMRAPAARESADADTLEKALLKASARITQQREWLENIKAAEKELSRPAVDYGW